MLSNNRARYCRNGSSKPLNNGGFASNYQLIALNRCKLSIYHCKQAIYNCTKSKNCCTKSVYRRGLPENSRG